MASGGEDENDSVLSDVEAEDAAPIEINTTVPESISGERYRELLAELERERHLRQAAENSKSEIQVSFNRLKVLAHEAIKKRDEATRSRDEAVRDKDEALKRTESISAEWDDMKKAKDSSRSEIETASSMLVSGIEKISGKVSKFKDFTSAGGGALPRSQKYTGLPAVAYGVIKRTNEIVEELAKQIELALKARDEAREQMEQRNYEIAIEVSQLEATISSLKEENEKKNSAIESLEEKERKMLELEKEMENEVAKLRDLVNGYENRTSDLESKMESQRLLVVDQLGFVAKIHEQICNVIKIVDPSKSSELSESLFLAQEMDPEENIRASLAGMESIHELSKIVDEKTRELMEEKRCEVKSLNETVSQLVKEKEQIGSLLRSAMLRRMSADLSSKTNELFKVAENGLREAGIDYKFSNHIEKGKTRDSSDKARGGNTEDDEVYALAGALENIIKQSQLEIIELKHAVDELRAESILLKEHAEAQAKELNQWQQRVEELEDKERVANENVEGLMLDVAAAEEEITRWKVAAQEEAAAGKAVEQEYMAQLSAIQRELEEAKQASVESGKKLKFKEETAAAAMAARDAAEKSLRLADLRATRLRDRVEELTRQLEELDTSETSRTGLTRPRYICWPWQWLGLDFVGSRRPETQQQSVANEMELSEPLL